MEVSDALPGADLLRDGLRDLENGVESIEDRLYALLAADNPTRLIRATAH